ncbi:unnamed protein product [Rhizophagus irregularis]|nr:unnamed protein product [Rhizophagus irregularis]CAB4386290.1 unnamed protein product [Rhizophagus irregularis]
MSSLSIPNIFKVLTDSDDLKTAVNRALYFEPVSHALKKYSFFSLTEEDIARTVKKSTSDGLLYTNLLMKHQEALSTFASVSKDMESACKKFVKQQMTSQKTNIRHIQICRGLTDGNRNFRNAKNTQTPIKSCSIIRETN